MNQDEFDRLFDQAFDSAVKDHQISPDPSASWKRVKDGLYRQKKKSQFLKMIPYLAASFVLGAVIFGTPVVTNAFPPFFQAIKSIQFEVVSLIFGSTDQTNSLAKTAPPSDEGKAQDGMDINAGSITNKQLKTWEEALNYVAFSTIQFNYIPSDLIIDDIRLFFNSDQDKANHAVMLYKNDSDQRMVITVRLLEQNETLSSNVNTDKGTLETIKINQSDAYLFQTTDGQVSLEYLLMNMYISISGNLSKEEIIKIATNIKLGG
jgi:Domain of unknown function (DUF4367)